MKGSVLYVSAAFSFSSVFSLLLNPEMMAFGVSWVVIGYGGV